MWIIVNGNANGKVMASWLMILACVCDIKDKEYGKNDMHMGICMS